MRIAGPRVPILILAQIVAALILAAGVELALERAGPAAMATALYALLAVVCFALLTLARAFVASRRVRMGGPGRGGGSWRGGSGVREPRRPRGPYMPPAAAAAVPERDEDTLTEPFSPDLGPIVLPEPTRRAWLPRIPGP